MAYARRAVSAESAGSVTRRTDLFPLLHPSQCMLAEIDHEPMNPVSIIHLQGCRDSQASNEYDVTGQRQ